MIRLIAFLVLASSQIAFSQKKEKVDDVYGSPSSAKKEPAYSVLEDIDFTIDNFVKGHIILKTGGIKRGLLRFNGATVIWKDTVTEKNTRYSATEINGFVAEADTINKDWLPQKGIKITPGFYGDRRDPSGFISINPLRKNPFEEDGNGTHVRVDTFKVFLDSFIVKAQGHFAEKVVHENTFVKELLYGNKVSLYRTTIIRISGGNMINGAMMSGYTSYKNVFYLKRKNDNIFTEIPTGAKAFKKLVSDYFRDNEPLIADVQAERKAYRDIYDIVNQYNQKN